jgi:hypothetical protein
MVSITMTTIHLFNGYHTSKLAHRFTRITAYINPIMLTISSPLLVTCTFFASITGVPGPYQVDDLSVPYTSESSTVYTAAAHIVLTACP